MHDKVYIKIEIIYIKIQPTIIDSTIFLTKITYHLYLMQQRKVCSFGKTPVLFGTKNCSHSMCTQRSNLLNKTIPLSATILIQFIPVVS